MEGYDVWEAFLTTDLPWITYWLTMFLMPAGIGAGVICIAQMNSFEIAGTSKKYVPPFVHFGNYLSFNALFARGISVFPLAVTNGHPSDSHLH